MLFVNPTGSNPTGSVLSEDRRREIYALAKKYDFLIIEDDAYYFVHFLDYKPTSFLSLDTDGRVIRVDSFSKIISAGIRIGILTAHRDIVKHLTTHTSSSTLHTSSLSQVKFPPKKEKEGKKRKEIFLPPYIISFIKTILIKEFFIIS